MAKAPPLTSRLGQRLDFLELGADDVIAVIKRHFTRYAIVQKPHADLVIRPLLRRVGREKRKGDFVSVSIVLSVIGIVGPITALTSTAPSTEAPSNTCAERKWSPAAPFAISIRVWAVGNRLPAGSAKVFAAGLTKFAVPAAPGAG